MQEMINSHHWSILMGLEGRERESLVLKNKQNHWSSVLTCLPAIQSNLIMSDLSLSQQQTDRTNSVRLKRVFLMSNKY